MKAVRLNKLRISAAVVGLAVLLQGCSTMVMRPVSESNKDDSGTFDGQWSAKIVSTARLQKGPGNWTFTCDDRAGTNLGTIVVDKGVATIQTGESTSKSTYISQKGKFRFEVPTEVIMAAAGTSDSTINNGSVTVIVQGSLDSGKGLFTLGIAEFSNSGCASKVVYRKL